MADDKLLEGLIVQKAYEQMTTRTEEEIDALRRREVELVAVEDGFLERVRYGLTLSTDVVGFYRRASVDVKGRLAGSIFPGKLRFIGGECRTMRVNDFYTLMAAKKDVLGNNDKGLTAVDRSQSFKAALSGFEPETP